MNIKEFASKPQLITVTLDEPSLIEKYGDSIIFYTYDVISLSTYFEFYTAKGEGDMGSLEKMIRKLVLDDQGKPVLAEDEDLPIDIATAAITKIGDVLGKSPRKASI